MRDSDVAIGGLVLLGIIGALVYFLFPTLISEVLRGPSYPTLLKKQQSELVAFEGETATIQAYLRDSWSMNAYRKLGNAIGRDGYLKWIEQVTTERIETVRAMKGFLDSEQPVLERLHNALELKLALRSKTMRRFLDLTKSPLDMEIDALQAELDRKTDELTHLLHQFAAKRRVLNQTALTGWFKRSMAVGFVAAAGTTVVFGMMIGTWSCIGAKFPLGKRSTLAQPRSLVVPDRRQSGLIEPAANPTLTDLAFHSSLRPNTGPIPESISSVLNSLPQSSLAQKLAIIVGGHPETPASRSHHLNMSGGLIEHTATALAQCSALLPMLPDPKIGPAVILAHDIGKVFTLNDGQEGRPHDIPSADIVASLPELREEFDEVTARSMILAIRHQHSKAEIPLNAPPLAETILQFIKKADLAASAQEARKAAEQMKVLIPRVLELFPFIIPELNVNGRMGGKAEGYLCDGYLYLLKESVKQKLLHRLEVQNAPVFKGQDPVWNEMALALAQATLITTKVGTKEAGKKSCIFTIKSPQGQEKVVAIPVAILAPTLITRWLQTNVPKIEVL